ncbi:sensor histidine kinase [Bacillus sp. JJ1521]|uniref:sensor histidine kinase n=1 Tax=Bacillus sp. JJ1521 TaxID=3122957 RepID=UPI002FFDEB2C
MFKKSIRNRLIVLLLLTTIVPFGTSIAITYFHIKESLKDQVVQENRSLLYQGKENLASYIRELNGLSLSLYNNPDIVSYLRSPQKENHYPTLDTLKDVLQTILYAEENIERVYITFSNDDRIISISKQSAVVFANKVENGNEEVLEKAKNSPGNMYIEPIHIQNNLDNIVNVKRPKTVLSIHRSFINSPSDHVLAYVTLEITPDKIFELSENLYNEENEEFYIVSAEGEFIYQSNQEKKADHKAWIETLVHTSEEQGTMEWSDDSFHGVMVYSKLPEISGNWMLVKRIPYTTLYESVNHVAIINILFGVIGLILVVLATLFVSFKITLPIRILLHNIRQVEEGNMDVNFQPLGEDEIGVLGNRFKQMIEKINHHINKEYKLELENKTNQLRVLQSQINPHFLYNALQSIGTLALKNNVPQIYSLITQLSKIMRYGMNMEEDIIPLIKEVNYIKAFLLLQKERFEEQLEFTIDVDEKAQFVKVPKMILQPIIENYFKHGFDDRTEVGNIALTCTIEDNELFIEVKDNGTGVSEERLQKIYSHFHSETSLGEGTNIGLKNVYARLKLYYHDQAALQLQNNEEGGLLVTMRLPIDVKGANYESNHYR